MTARTRRDSRATPMDSASAAKISEEIPTVARNRAEPAQNSLTAAGDPSKDLNIRTGKEVSVSEMTTTNEGCLHDEGNEWRCCRDCNLEIGRTVAGSALPTFMAYDATKPPHINDHGRPVDAHHSLDDGEMRAHIYVLVPPYQARVSVDVTLHFGMHSSTHLVLEAADARRLGRSLLAAADAADDANKTRGEK